MCIVTDDAVGRDPQGVAFQAGFHELRVGVLRVLHDGRARKLVDEIGVFRDQDEMDGALRGVHFRESHQRRIVVAIRGLVKTPTSRTVSSRGDKVRPGVCALQSPGYSK